LVFKANTPDKGVELVRLSDGVATVFDINPNGNSNPAWLTLIGDDLYFAADDGAHGFELWKLSPGGSPQLVRDIKPGRDSSYPEYLKAAADERTVVFKADDGVHGMELWRSDGRSTAMVQDLEPGPGSSSPVDLKLIGEQLFFVAAPSSSGMEFFVLDGVDLQPKIYLPLLGSN
jgi:ELWxxDGT repeat protein